MFKRIGSLSVILLLFIVGCTNSTFSEENQKLKDEINQLKIENETLEEQIFVSNALEDDLLEKIGELSRDHQTLQQELNERDQSYLYFGDATTVSRSFINAMIRGDKEELEHLTTSNLQVDDGYFKEEINNEVIEIPYHQFSTESYQNHQVIIAVQGYHFSDGILRVVYSTTDDDVRAVFHVELMEEEGQWQVNSIAYDI